MQRFTFPEHGGQLYADRIRFYMDAMGARYEKTTKSYVANHGITELLDAVMTDAEFAELQAQVDERITGELEDRLSDVACRFVAAMVAHDLAYHWEDDPQDTLVDFWEYDISDRDLDRMRDWSRFLIYIGEHHDCNAIVWYGPAVNDVPVDFDGSYREDDLTGIEEWVIEHSE